MTSPVNAGGRAGDSDDRFRVLFVCTGNICRSPLAERLTRLWLDERMGAKADLVEVASAGTHGLPDHPMDEDAARVLGRYGGSSCGFRSRPLSPETVAAADLVVGMERAHRGAAVQLAPAVLRRAFTLRELARLAEADLAEGGGGDHAEGGDHAGGVRDGDRVARARAAVGRAAGLRGTLPPASGSDDVDDPVGGSPEVHARVGEEIADALRPVVAVLCGAPAVGHPGGDARH